MIIRAEKESDINAIYAVNLDAFGTDVEARLVNTLRNSDCEFISLVAEIKNNIVGHILFTPVQLDNNDNHLKIIGLAPMAVLKRHQNQGIGSQLVKEGLKLCQSLGYGAAVVLGHPDYYPKFGFLPSVIYGIKSEYDVPDNVFMVKELVNGYLKDHNGIIKYHAAFNNA